jgi:N-acyl-D-aspartate/D-glutamate deacylase
MITSPLGLIGTDAGAHLDRFYWYGTPARLLGHWTREEKLLTLEEAVHKLTGFAASKIHINRGQLKVGWPADITVFDPDRIDDLVSARLPEKVNEVEVQRHPPGIQAVIVNGQTVVESGECMDVFPGKTTKAGLSPAVPA